MNRIIIACLFLISTCGAQAQEINREKRIFSLTAGAQHGFIFAHSPEVENTKGANPTGAELYFGWQRGGRTFLSH